MTKKKMVVFTNCHGERYINMFHRDSKIGELFDIDYIVSYMQLDNFAHLKNRFETADILITNKVKNYNEFTISNLKNLLKPDTILIVIPFVRFEGYWLPETYARLMYFEENSVSFFPNLKPAQVDDYLNITIDEQVLQNHFERCLEKLKSIEQESDIQFFDFFMENHTKYPMFRDNYHPTMNMLEYMGGQIMKKINEHINIEYTDRHLALVQNVEEYGHFKPIINVMKQAIGLQYDLDKIFICSRKEYLSKILNYETSPVINQKIQDLDDMKLKLFSDSFSK